MTAIDVGANVGFYTSFFSKLVGDSGRVVAFEPDKRNFRHLRQTIQGKPNVEVNNNAVGDRQGPLKLYLSKSLNVDHQTYDSGDNRKFTSIRSVRLDDYFSDSQKIDFLKIDTQGYDYHVYLGAKNMIKRSPNIVIFSEFWPYGLNKAGYSPNTYLSDLEKDGFTIRFFDDFDHTKTNRQISNPDYYTDFIAYREQPNQIFKDNSVSAHFDKLAPVYDENRKRYGYYYEKLKEFLSKKIPPKKKVLDVGCGTGTLLASLHPQFGYGIDISQAMIRQARNKFRRLPNLQFSTTFDSLKPETKFDYIFMADVIEHLPDPKTVFEQISRHMTKNSIFICTMANPLWEPYLMCAEKLKLKMPEGDHHRWKFTEITSFLNNSRMAVVDHGNFLLMPVYVPLLTRVVNQFLEPHLKSLSFVDYFVAKKSPSSKFIKSKSSHI